MTGKTEYAVLRFVAQDQYSHMVHDYVQGYSIMEYVKEGVVFDKQKAFVLAKDLAKQLEQFYKCEEEDAYGYVNPYAVIITEEDSVLLLDIWAEENKALLEKMKKRKVRALFVSPEYILSQKKRQEDDLYGFGKTIQFLLEKCCGKNVFTFREGKILKRIYEKCEQKEKANIGKWRLIQKSLNRLNGVEKSKKNHLRYIGALLIVIILCVSCVIGGVYWGKQRYRLNKQEIEEMQNAEKMEKELRYENAVKNLELGLFYLAGDNTSETGLGLLKEAAEEIELAENYITIFEYLQKDALDDSEKEIVRTVLGAGKEEVVKHNSDHYIIPFLNAYTMLDEEQAWNEIIALAEPMERSKTVRKYTAHAYEKLGNYEAAIVEYEELKKMENMDTDLQLVYEKLMELYYTVDLPDKVKANYEEAVSLMPKLGSNEEFLKLKEEYGIGMESEVSGEVLTE